MDCPFGTVYFDGSLGHEWSESTLSGYSGLHMVTVGYIQLQWVTYGYIGLHMVTVGYIWLHTVGYIRLLWVTYDYSVNLKLNL